MAKHLNPIRTLAIDVFKLEQYLTHLHQLDATAERKNPKELTLEFLEKHCPHPMWEKFYNVAVEDLKENPPSDGEMVLYYLDNGLSKNQIYKLMRIRTNAIVFYSNNPHQVKQVEYPAQIETFGPLVEVFKPIKEILNSPFTLIPV